MDKIADERLRRIALLRAYTERDGQGMLALIYDLPPEDAERLIDLSFAEGARMSGAFGREGAAEIIDNLHATELVRLWLAADGYLPPDDQA